MLDNHTAMVGLYSRLGVAPGEALNEFYIEARNITVVAMASHYVR